MIKLTYWINIHKFLLKYKKLIFNLFSMVTILAVAIVFFGFYLFDNNPLMYSNISGLGESAGTFALGLFLLTLLPGILSRFKIFPLVTASIVLFRRQIGILMFIVAIVHSFYISTIPAIMTSTFGLEFLSQKELFGSISLMILLPVWLTSNDLSQRAFGKLWKIIQRLSYFSLIAIFLHVSLSSTKLGVITFIVLGLEALSWLKIWFSNKSA